ncbi:Methyl-accepting chemotaxis protein [Tistlia consotensis]|uniref:Methyl-accepting chemotaxis protein n=1 Tax=Tistlia consotensis USBA 355 TaxID=560819 RepID=A0A1Y6CRA0_9PROT|nr:hypothetical protein [Tistlia consotensis]SMF84830.1 Methyl-accepting chemotaxis protein [Tistlia consotensis USBA 355]SNS08537.1 Methyl-accepting chemotaxis protein [Tistlia consotensis]
MAHSNASRGRRSAQTESAGVADAIGLARALTEDRFLAVGEGLESSIGILGRLSGTFQALQAELESDSLHRAAGDIAGAAEGVTALSGAYREEREALGRLAEAAATIDGRIGRMHKAVKAVDVLGVSAKIEAMHLGEAGSDFLGFANEIHRSLKLAQQNLVELARELTGLRGHLEQSAETERAFDRQHGEALRLVPARLTASVEAIAGRSRAAGSSAAAVAGRSREIGQRVGDAVMALQVGDITRQRVEHVEAALARLDQVEQPDLAEWRDLTDGERRRLVALGCRLQSAQLSDAAAELERDAGRIAASLDELTASAREIARLGEQAYGGSARGRSAFLLDLEAEVAQARALLDGFRTARAGADAVVEAVREGTTRLAEHVGTIQSLEADIRIMGLNTTLKCGRLGGAGKPLAVVAQELRVCANQTGVEAEAVMAGVERMTDCLGALSGEAQARRADEIAAVAEALTGSVERLGAAGQGLADALRSLGHDSEAVTGLLAETRARITVHEEIGAVLRQAAADLAQRAAAAGPDAGDAGAAGRGVGALPAAGRELLAGIARSYTMAQERETHARVTGEALAAPAGATPPPGQGAAEVAVDDFLF